MSEELTRVGEGLFKVVRRGYDQQEVDTYVGHLRSQIHELQERNNEDEAVREALERVGEEVSAILQQAHQTANGIIAAAQRDADEHMRQVEAHASEILSVAERRVHDLDLDTDRIWAERERIVADARDLAGQLQRVADLAAERFPTVPGSEDAAAAGLDERNAGN